MQREALEIERLIGRGWKRIMKFCAICGKLTVHFKRVGEDFLVYRCYECGRTERYSDPHPLPYRMRR